MLSRTYRAALATALTGLVALALAAPAGAADPRVPIDPGKPFTLTGYCNFPVLVEYVDFNQYIIHQSYNPTTGGLILQITGRARVKLTNTDTGKTVTYNISGPGTVEFWDASGTQIKSGNLAGPNLLWTTRANLAQFPEVPTISYTTGHVTFEVARSGQTTAYSLAGGARQTDVCAVLAP
jgi:hypothetical protein